MQVALDAAALAADPPTGSGLRLRLWDPGREDDVNAYFRGVTEPEFRRWNTPLQPVATPDQARAALVARRRQFDRGVGVAFCVVTADTGVIVGHLGLNTIDAAMRRALVGYWVLPEARGRHVASRALALGSDWAFSVLRLHRLELDHAVGHAVSCRVAERAGFAYEGTMRGRMFAAGRRDAFRDAHLHARLADDPVPAYRPR